jgi:chromatin remodeling complex protein RSC6
MAKAKTTQTSTNVASNTQAATPAPAVNTQQEAAPSKAVKRVVKKAEQAVEQVAAPVATPAPAVQEAAPAKAVKRSASKKSESAPEQVAAPVATPAPAVQEAAPAKSAKRVAKKEQAATPAPQVAATASTSQESEAQVTENVSIEERINQLVALNEQFTAAQKELSALLKRAQKLHAREAKEAAIQNSRNQAKRARAAGEDGERKRCGFSATPTLLSDGICTFLNIPVGSRLPRTDVNKLVTAYIKTNKLENPSNRRSFIPDSKLQTLLGPLQDKHKEDGYSYFNIQTYLAQHFLKTEKSQTVAASQ